MSRRNRRLKMIWQKWIRVDPVNKAFDILCFFLMGPVKLVAVPCWSWAGPHLDKFSFFQAFVSIRNFIRWLTHSPFILSLKNPGYTGILDIDCIYVYSYWVIGYLCHTCYIFIVCLINLNNGFSFNKCKFIYHLWIDFKIFNCYYIQYIVVNKIYQISRVLFMQNCKLKFLLSFF